MAEAYVVPGMTVPILLGEDYQLTYEIGVTRNVEEGPKVHFGKSEWELKAQQVQRTTDFERMRQSAYSIGRFIRSKLHRRRKSKRHRQKVKFGEEERVVRAKEDYRLRPHECKPIRVEGQLGEDRDWLVSKTLLSGSDDTYFAIPNTLISAANPWVPVTNPSDQPRYVRKGEIVGVLSDPSEYFDKVHTLSDWENRCKHADAIAAIIQIQMDADRGVRKETTVPTEHETPDMETSADESFGPKTAEMPDLTEYPSSKMKDVIDVGSLPDHLKDKAWCMLEKRVNAFGFDGRLGHLPTKVHIRTADGQVPISVPMYGSSPEKRRFMDIQLNTWFEQGVIEPSISPWSTPVVIAYQNGKPRFCIDYRKLNAVTTPDKFPIPRQSEILSSFISWWTASISGWDANLDAHTTRHIKEMELDCFRKRGVLVNWEKDWREINIPNYVQHGVPMAYPWTTSLASIPCFTSLSPHVLRAYEESRLAIGYELHSDDLPDLKDDLSIAKKYDQFLQDISGDGRPDPDMEFNEGWCYYVVDFQGWSRRHIPLCIACEYYVLFTSTVTHEEDVTVVLFQCWETLGNPAALARPIVSLEDDPHGCMV